MFYAKFEAKCFRFFHISSCQWSYRFYPCYMFIYSCYDLEYGRLPYCIQSLNIIL